MSAGTLVWTAPDAVIVGAVVLGVLTLALAVRGRGGQRRGLELALLLPALVAAVVAAVGGG